MGFLPQSLSSRDQFRKYGDYPSWFCAAFTPRAGDTAQPHRCYSGAASHVRILGYWFDVREVLAGAIELRASKRGETWLGPFGESIPVVLGILV